MIPSIKKLTTDGFFLMSIKTLIERTQNNNNRTSVDTKKDETLTAGMIKKLKAQINEMFFCKSSFLQKL